MWARVLFFSSSRPNSLQNSKPTSNLHAIASDTVTDISIHLKSCLNKHVFHSTNIIYSIHYYMQRKIGKSRLTPPRTSQAADIPVCLESHSEEQLLMIN